MAPSSPALFGFGSKKKSKYSNLEAVSPKPEDPFFQEAGTPYPQVIHPRSTPFLHIVEPDYSSSRGWDTTSATLFSTPPPSRDYAPVPEYTRYEPSPAAIPSAEQNRRSMRFSDKTFWTIIFVVGFLIAAAIGGGIGGGLVASSHSRCGSDSRYAEKNKQREKYPANHHPHSHSHADAEVESNTGTSPGSSKIPSTATAGTGTNTPTATTGVTAGVPSPAPVDEGCPNINGTTYVPKDALGLDIPLKTSTGTAQQSFVRLCRTDYPVGKEYGNGGIHDIFKVYLPSLEECINACAMYNQRYQNKMDKGVPVVGGFCKTVSIVKKAGGYCYLKNGTANNFQKEADPDLTSSAFILGF